MAIDLETQRVMNLREAAKHFPSYKDGKDCHVSRVLRSILKGTSVPGVERIRLEALNLIRQRQVKSGNRKMCLVSQGFALINEVPIEIQGKQRRWLLLHGLRQRRPFDLALSY